MRIQKQRIFIVWCFHQALSTFFQSPPPPHPTPIPTELIYVTISLTTGSKLLTGGDLIQIWQFIPKNRYPEGEEGGSRRVHFHLGGDPGNNADIDEDALNQRISHAIDPLHFDIVHDPGMWDCVWKCKWVETFLMHLYLLRRRRKKWCCLTVLKVSVTLMIQNCNTIITAWLSYVFRSIEPITAKLVTVVHHHEPVCCVKVGINYWLSWRSKRKLKQLVSGDEVEPP